MSVMKVLPGTVTSLKAGSLQEAQTELLHSARERDPKDWLSEPKFTLSPALCSVVSVSGDHHSVSFSWRTSMAQLHIRSGKKQNEGEPAVGCGKSKEYLVVGVAFSENSPRQRRNRFIKRQQLVASKTYSLTAGC